MMAQHLTNIGSVQAKGGSDISGKEVYTGFTSEQIRPFGSVMAGRDGTPVEKQ